jgi:hypothetical protein
MPSTLSQSWTYSIQTAAVGAPEMSRAHWRLARASHTERPRLQHPIAWNRFSAELQIAPSGSQLSVQNLAVAPSPS